MTLDRRSFLQGSALLATAAALPALAQETPTVSVAIDTREVIGPLPHVWEECVGSDRAAITLRDSWRRDLDRGRKEAGFKRIRCHGIFCDELGVFAPSILSRGDQPPNYQNVDEVYDGLIARDVSPYVELSFMPKRLASGDRSFGFYAGNITPPTSNEAWADFVKSFVIHLVERYGLSTVRDWPFEVWNEPNLPFFWAGTKQQYLDLYKATSVAIKSVDPSLQVGGPSTAETAWIGDFAAYCAQANAPIDFFSTHIYAGDAQTEIFGPGIHFPLTDVIPEAVKQVRQRIDATGFASKPLWLSEWSSDSPAMIGHVIAQCLPHCHAMSHWALSGEFEELGVAKDILSEGPSGWGMLAKGGIPMPAYNTYRLLHALGFEQLRAQGPALASRRPDRSVAAMVWNLADVAQPSGVPDAHSKRTVNGTAKRFEISFAGAKPRQSARVQFVDQARGSPMPAWREMGSPQYIKPDQLKILRQRAEIQPAITMKLDDAGRLVLDLPPEGVALVELSA